MMTIENPNPEISDSSPDAVEEEIRSLGDTLASRAHDDRKQAGEALSARKRAWATWPLAAVLVVVAALVTTLNVTGVGYFERALPPPEPQAVERGLEADLLAAVGYVEDYRTEHGRLPDTVEDLGMASEDFGYRRVGEDYVVTVARGAMTREHDSRFAAPGGGP